MEQDEALEVVVSIGYLAIAGLVATAMAVKPYSTGMECGAAGAAAAEQILKRSVPFCKQLVAEILAEPGQGDGP